MTVDEWLRCTDPTPMLYFLRENGIENSRKLRLFGCASLRRLPLPSTSEVELSERFADSMASKKQMRRALGQLGVVRGYSSAWAVSNAERTAQSHFLRDIFGLLPFRPVRLEPAWLEWNGDTVKKLAQAAYEERHLPGGALDNGRLAVLADALEEAGCADEDVLLHLRQQGAVHVRGCWVVDLVLGKR
jgi:hypothetical protein